MLEWLAEISSWIWENISNIDSIVSIVTAILSGVFFIGGAVYGVIANILRQKLKRNQYKYLNLVVDNQTKQSMKYYIPTRAQEVDPCDDVCTTDSFIKLIPFFINKVFKNSDTRYFVILADSGMGKTTFLLKLFFEYYKKLIKEYDIVFIPLSLESSIERIRGIQNKTTTILLLDGLDEDRYAIEDYNKRLKDICDETELFYKVIISCRTQFFPDSDSEPRHTKKRSFGVGKKSIEFVKYYISLFNEKEINIYLSKKYNPIFERNKIRRSQKVIKNCPELMVRPMLLAYIDDLIEDKEREYNYAYEIYNQLVYSWIEREAINNETLYNFSEKIAEYMYSNKTVYIKGNIIQKICEEYGIQLSSFEAKTRSLLNRNANGIYKFAHKSILEFILANKAIKDTQFRKVIMLNGFDGYDMLELFLKEMSISYVKKLINRQTRILENVFCEFLQLSEIDLSHMKIKNCSFENCNLSKAVFRKGDFYNISLKGSNLYGADLRNVKFRGADLRGADLRGADLRGGHINRIKLEGANLYKTIFDEIKIDFLQMKYNLADSMVYSTKTRTVVSYKEYKKRRATVRGFLVDDDEFEFEFLNNGVSQKMEP
ncbi:pentapeptide repeat-containing protein [Parablautia muri]|uniref:Pentapeptide repeat-containing protein n=1 Tax=Parablautia muri TaxID=2320879 RepID=A0A9X5BKP4_9FIRM|nr:pentapeptide repeat-containing protein [Parablautia muri]NBJ95489.1 hypothetical protein [Parablautia muri]